MNILNDKITLHSWCWKRLFCRSFADTFSCDWSQHQRSIIVTDRTVDLCMCNTATADKCNWLICMECYLKCTNDLKATHQMYGLQVCALDCVLCLICYRWSTCTVETKLQMKNKTLYTRITGGIHSSNHCCKQRIPWMRYSAIGCRCWRKQGWPGNPSTIK